MKIKAFPNAQNKNQDYNNFNSLPYSLALIARDSIKKKIQRRKPKERNNFHPYEFSIYE